MMPFKITDRLLTKHICEVIGLKGVAEKCRNVLSQISGQVARCLDRALCQVISYSVFVTCFSTVVESVVLNTS